MPGKGKIVRDETLNGVVLSIYLNSTTAWHNVSKVV
jgi:hypothetical protein